MTGSRKRPNIDTPPDPSPQPMPIAGREEDEAKKKIRARRGGRASTILAGKMMSQTGNILNTKLG